MKIRKWLGLVLVIVFLTSMIPLATTVSAATINFTGKELLGRPEANSISISVVPDSAISLYYQYSTTAGGPYTNTSTTTATAGQPKVVQITGLTANTKYYYRMQYSTDSGSTWNIRDEHSFRTQRAAGSAFTFDITTDSHINIQLGTASNWTSTLNKIATDAPDFLIDLGDTVAMDNGSSSVALGDTAAAEQKYKDTLQYFNTISANSALFTVAGNHEQQEAWHLQGTLANSLPVMSKNAEKKFFLNPVNDSFYSGDTSTQAELSGDHLKQDYYAWTWGDALFVVISPYWTTTTKPYTTTAGGGETDATGSGDRWDWTLGQTQFNWLKTTLQNSNAKYKLVFAHQMVGGNGMTSPVNQVNYGHGGVDSANFVEWGGYNINGTTWAWDTERPGWGSQPIRQMMEANGVSAFFHGHDHQYAYEKLNGIVYQSVPSGSFSGSFGAYTTGGNSGNTIWADSTQGPGYLKVTVGPSQTTVDFIRYNGTTPANTYNILPAAATNNAPVITEGTSTAVNMSQNGTPTAFGLTLHGTDTDGDTLTWSISSAASHGTASASGTGASKAITYTPTTNYSGSDSFAVQVSDGKGGTDIITVNVTIAAAATATIQGTTYEANGNILGSVTVTIDGGASVVSASNGTYQISVSPGTHNVVASKTGYRSQTVSNFSAATAGNTYTLDFKGNNSLVPNVVSQSYLLACVSKYRLQPTDGTAINQSKILSVVSAYKNPL